MKACFYDDDSDPILAIELTDGARAVDTLDVGIWHVFIDERDRVVGLEVIDLPEDIEAELSVPAARFDLDVGALRAAARAALAAPDREVTIEVAEGVPA